MLARVLGMWTLNAARVVFVIDEPGRFGFAYGTLPRHVESGEERFLVERDAAGEVYYEEGQGFTVRYSGLPGVDVP